MSQEKEKGDRPWLESAQQIGGGKEFNKKQMNVPVCHIEFSNKMGIFLLIRKCPVYCGLLEGAYHYSDTIQISILLGDAIFLSL